ncbi:MAG: thioesterase family protein [Acidobacteriota bacterium]|nr:thioesterase family protein [Acidobacteriota bacterium]MDE2924023.1 thioesterase family protein [Acidobacteriota bacterium]MDE3264985.1 thioesterase family protein [Acidobacteriota bacterium]
MTFETGFETRHSDCFAATGFVHAGVLLALTEMAYARFEQHCGIDAGLKPEHIYAVQRSTTATYYSPLRWQEGARIRVRTTEANERGFDQDFEVLSAADGREVARFTHRWVLFDTRAGRPVPLSEDLRQRLLAPD